MVSILIFTADMLETFEHYKRAFNAKNVGMGYGSHNELIHIDMDIMGYRIALAPHAPHEITKGNVTVIGVTFQDKETLMKAYETLKEGGQTDGLQVLPWSPLQGYVTDKYGVVWCIGI